jgi:hypothetical protein
MSGVMMHQLLVQELTLWEHPEKTLSEKVFGAPFLLFIKILLAL